MTFASIFETFKNKKKIKTASKEDDKNPTQWTFSNGSEKKGVSEKSELIEEETIAIKQKFKKDIEVELHKSKLKKDENDINREIKENNKKESIIEDDKKNSKEEGERNGDVKKTKKDIKKEKRLKDSLKYLNTIAGKELINPSFETLNDEAEFLKIKKYELKKIKKENADLIQDDKEIKKSIENFQEKLIKRIEKYNYFVGALLEDITESIPKKDKNSKSDIDSHKFIAKSIIGDISIKNDDESVKLLIEHKDLKKLESQNIEKTETLLIGEYSNVGETIMRYLFNNASKLVSGPMGWNPEVFESVEDWSVKRSLGIVEEFRVKYPEKNLANVCCGVQIVLDITNKENLKIVSIEKKNVIEVKNGDFEFLNVNDYKKYFDKILSEIFNNNLNEAKEMQVIDIENSVTEGVLLGEQITKFREVKYMIGEIIGEASISKEEILKNYTSRVVEEMFNKCKKNGICDDNEKRVFDKIFEL